MGDYRAVVEPVVDDAEPFVDTVQSRLYGRSYGDCRAMSGDSRAVVEPVVETIIRLPSILVLHVSRALELQIGLYGASCRAFTKFCVELLQSFVSSFVLGFGRAPCTIPPESFVELL